MIKTTAILNAPRHRTKLERGFLKNDRMELSFLPDFGCHWTRLRISVKGEWVDLLKPVADGDALLDKPTGHGSYILAPWSNRIPRGEFRFDGTSYRLRTNFRDGSSIHGDVRLRPWKVIRSNGSLFEVSLDSSDFEDFNFPFALHYRHVMELTADGLHVRMICQNADSVRVPVGLGYHPFFLRRLTWRDDDLILVVPAEVVYPADGCIPTGPAIPVDGRTDLRHFRLLGNRDLDHCFTELMENQCRLIYPGSRVEVRLETDSSFSHVVVYAPNNANGVPEPCVAVEPVTHANNGFNLFENGWEGTGVKMLEPGEKWETAWSLSVGDI